MTSAARETPPGLLREPRSICDFCSKEDSARPGNGPYVPSWEWEENLILMVMKPDRPTRSGEGKRPLSGTSTLLRNPAKSEGRALTLERGGKLKRKSDELRRKQMKDKPHQRPKEPRLNKDGKFLPNIPDL